jgi:predicted nucleotidyltransferase
MLIHKYNFNLPLIAELKSIINKDYKDLFIAVIIHGSVATAEVTKYSDFDGLLIVKDEFVNSKKLKSFKKETFKRILFFDPLQHHGWFQINESDLLNYPESYFPNEILNYSKLIYPCVETFDLEININKNPDYKRVLWNVLNSIEDRIQSNWTPNNIFQLKSVLSQIMLIPSMYYSAKHNKGIFKKYSFNAVRNDFNENEWYAINRASEIRNAWGYNLNCFQQFIMRRPEKVFRKITQKFIAPKLNEKLEWDRSIYQSLELLIVKIKLSLNETD